MRVAVLGIKRLPAQAGADRVVERLLQHESGRHEYTVYLLRDGGETLSCADGRHYVYVPGVGGKHLRAFSYFLLCCLHYLVRGRYDVVHVHNSDFGSVAPLLRLKRRVRVIGTFHGNPYERVKWGRGARAFLRASEWLFVRSCHMLTSVAPSKSVTGHRVRFIPNGIDPWRSGELPPDYAALGVEPGRYVLFACGRLDSTKGLHHLLVAYRELPDAPPLLAVGDFSHDLLYAQRIRDAAAALPRVTLHEELLPRETLLDLVHAARVFVFPSEVEGMSMMLLEALPCARVVVCSDIAENVAVVGADYPYLFRSGDPSSLRDVLAHALAADDPAADARPSVEQAVARFRWDRIAAEYERLYAGA
jgi:glycosyltransferase involved in cell wall biosynthesis